MQVDHNKVVSFHYTLRDERGAERESSRSGEPSQYLHGAKNIMPALEQAFTGREAGDVFTQTLDADDAYGAVNPERQQRVPVKHLLFKGRLRPGMVVQLNTGEGRVPVTVIKTGKFSADVDTNHPLAGQSLSFDVEIVDIREATAEEIAHRHAHGPGGHQH